MSGAGGRSWPTRRGVHTALATVVVASALPYGYTVSVWSSGAVLIRSHGVPRVAEVFSFVAGAVIGFAVMGLIAHGTVARSQPVDHPPDRVLAGTLHWLAVGVAVGAVALVAQIHGWAAWPLGSFAATSIYIFGTSVQLALVSARRR